MALRTVTWFLIIGCLAAVAVSAPTSVEDSSSEESTTVGAATLPGTLPENKKTKRETDKQEAQKPETPVEDWKKPTESSYTAPPKANDRLSRAADEQKPQSETDKSSEENSHSKEDEIKNPQKRHVEQDKESKKVGATKDSSFLRRPLSTIAEEPEQRAKRATSLQKPQVSRPRPNAPTNNHPGIRPQNNYLGNGRKSQQQPGGKRKPNQPGGGHGHPH
ncbi:activating signal cointegrator 1 complex subunit 2 homolog isoform X1 [Cryptotermes secundus]|uniref:activating signal cointegrator 1 complex subunit 2 homolog isoform X1 n=1 Tax=Cryptotermes secundus TaxID=105785 RepID=UPI000CD7DF8F|nr:activating signal cointegrator 1 complex subunit 2 homolog isoform X1 [Cryptotermes secundus]